MAKTKGETLRKRPRMAATGREGRTGRAAMNGRDGDERALTRGERPYTAATGTDEKNDNNIKKHEDSDNWGGGSGMLLRHPFEAALPEDADRRV